VRKRNLLTGARVDGIVSETRLPGRAGRLLLGLGAVVVLVAGCSGQSDVQPGPPAAGASAAAIESGGIGTDLPAPSPTCVNAPAGWSSRENAMTGTRDLPPGRAQAWKGPVVGYLDSSTAVCGQTLGVHLFSPKGDVPVRLRALRVGHYNGAGSRLVWQSPSLVAGAQHQAQPTGPDRVIRESWPVTTRLTVDASWPPGFYLVEIAPLDPAITPSFIPLVVRTSGVRSPYLVLVSELTWMAYNSYGGRSLYLGPGGDHEEEFANRSYVASADRPLVGTGIQQMFAMDLPLIRFLSQHNLAADVTTDSSLDAQPSQIVGQRTVVIGGHAEYWTRRMYDAAVAARDAGTNFAFLGGNEIYWQGRIERDESGRMTALTVFKDQNLDRHAENSPTTTTVKWADPPLSRDPASLVGQGMSVVGLRATYVVAATPAWLFHGTGLSTGDQLPLAVGNESDAQEPPGGSSPANLEVVLHAVGIGADTHKPSEVTAGYYSAPSGAGVFSAGTTYWPCGLDATCPKWDTPAQTSAALQALTLNILTAFAVRRAGSLHPSTGTPFQTTSQLAGQLPIGTPMR